MRDVAFRKTFFSDTRMEAGIMGREAQLRKTGGGRKGVSAEGNGRFSAQGVRIAGEKALSRKLSVAFGEREACGFHALTVPFVRGGAGQSCVGKKRRASENRARERASRRPVSGLVRQKRPGHARYQRSSCMEKGPGKAGNRNASGERKPDSGVSGRSVAVQEAVRKAGEKLRMLSRNCRTGRGTGAALCTMWKRRMGRPS